jgi:c-di-GMP-binding flagellar brake protein YcgR
MGASVGEPKREVERRRFDRFPVELPISYALVSTSDVSTGMAVNLSEGGLLGYFLDRIGIGTELDLEVFYTYQCQFTALSAQARIVWKDIIETTEAIEYQYGMEFTEMEKGQKSKLRKLLASIKPTSPYLLRKNLYQKKQI